MGRITAFVIGGLAGACAALALAPKTGADMRAAVADQAITMKDNIMGSAGQGPQQVYQDVVETATNFAAGARDQVANAVSDIKGGASKVQEDELRQKIEAARQRIADQVLQNAEESRAAVEETEAVVEAVEEVEEATEE